MKIDYRSKTFRLVFSALMIALSTVLSLIELWKLPFGGSITPGSMVPLVIVCQLYGFKWGLFTCTAHGLLQMLLGANNFAYAVSFWAVLAIAVFDYLGAFGAMSLSALTRKMNNKPLAAVLGCIIGCLARFVCHFFSGVTVWGEWADISSVPQFLHDTALVSEDMLVYSYSFFYNSFMFVEMIIAAVLSAFAWWAVSGMTEKKSLKAAE